MFEVPDLRPSPHAARRDPREAFRAYARADLRRARILLNSPVGPAARRSHSPPRPTVPIHRFDAARFATSVADLSELNAAPLAMVPEVAFVGRSNAGKSSAINALTGRRRLAFSAKTPGRTQLLNFFALVSRDAAGRETTLGYLVDLPGYGFAKVDADTRARWDRLVGGYLQTRRMLRGVVLVMDARHPLKPADEELLGWLAARADAHTLRVHVLLNKADQLRGDERRAAVARVERRAADLPMPVSVQLFSALKREGVEELRAAIDEMLAR